jgi:hypothetical protein
MELAGLLDELIVQWPFWVSWPAMHRKAASMTPLPCAIKPTLDALLEVKLCCQLPCLLRKLCTTTSLQVGLPSTIHHGWRRIQSCSTTALCQILTPPAQLELRQDSLAQRFPCQGIGLSKWSFQISPWPWPAWICWFTGKSLDRINFFSITQSKPDNFHLHHLFNFDGLVISLLTALIVAKVGRLWL